LLFRDQYSAEERDNARFYLGFDALTTAASFGIADEMGKAFLALSSDVLSGLEQLDKAGDERKRRHDQSRSQANVTITSSRSSGGSAGGTGSYIYTQPITSIDGRSDSRRTFGGYSFTAAQQGALDNFVSVVNGSFNAQAFVSALQAVVTAFGVK